MSKKDILEERMLKMDQVHVIRHKVERKEKKRRGKKSTEKSL